MYIYLEFWDLYITCGYIYRFKEGRKTLQLLGRKSQQQLSQQEHVYKTQQQHTIYLEPKITAVTLVIK